MQKRTFKIGEEVTILQLPNILNKEYSNRQFDFYVDSMLKDAKSNKVFEVVSRVKDKWYKIQDISDEYGNSWYVRYNWITPVEVEEGPITKIIWKAITYLQDYEGCNPDRLGEKYSSQFTCDCLERAYWDIAEQNGYLSNVKYDDVMDFLNSLGFKYAFNSFKEYEEGEARQGARFQWLHFAYWIAKEEGI